jgi:hypothetical protein
MPFPVMMMVTKKQTTMPALKTRADNLSFLSQQNASVSFLIHSEVLKSQRNASICIAIELENTELSGGRQKNPRGFPSMFYSLMYFRYSIFTSLSKLKNAKSKTQINPMNMPKMSVMFASNARPLRLRTRVRAGEQYGSRPLLGSSFPAVCPRHVLDACLSC